MRRLALVAGCLAAAAWAPAQAASTDPCLPPRATILEDNGRVVVYDVNEIVYGCARSVGERKRITALGLDDQVSTVAIAGGYVAVATRYCSRYEQFAPCEAGSLHLVRVTRPGRRRIRLDNHGQREVSDIVLRATGDVAFIAPAGRRSYVWRVEGRRRTLLDSGTRIEPHSLERVARDRVSWRAGTRTRSARLGRS